MSLELPNFALKESGFPRVSGDEPGSHHDALLVGAFSPRERG